MPRHSLTRSKPQTMHHRGSVMKHDFICHCDPYAASVSTLQCAPSESTNCACTAAETEASTDRDVRLLGRDTEDGESGRTTRLSCADEERRLQHGQRYYDVVARAGIAIPVLMFVSDIVSDVASVVCRFAHAPLTFDFPSLFASLTAMPSSMRMRIMLDRGRFLSASAMRSIFASSLLGIRTLTTMDSSFTISHSSER